MGGAITIPKSPVGYILHSPVEESSSGRIWRFGRTSVQASCLSLLQPLCPKELWHFVHQCYGNELGLTSDDEDYVPPDDDFNTMG